MSGQITVPTPPGLNGVKKRMISCLSPELLFGQNLYFDLSNPNFSSIGLLHDINGRSSVVLNPPDPGMVGKLNSTIVDIGSSEHCCGFAKWDGNPSEYGFSYDSSLNEYQLYLLPRPQKSTAITYRNLSISAQGTLAYSITAYYPSPYDPYPGRQFRNHYYVSLGGEFVELVNLGNRIFEANLAVHGNLFPNRLLYLPYNRDMLFTHLRDIQNSHRVSIYVDSSDRFDEIAYASQGQLTMLDYEIAAGYDPGTPLSAAKVFRWSSGNRSPIPKIHPTLSQGILIQPSAEGLQMYGSIAEGSQFFYWNTGRRNIDVTDLLRHPSDKHRFVFPQGIAPGGYCFAYAQNFVNSVQVDDTYHVYSLLN